VKSLKDFVQSGLGPLAALIIGLGLAMSSDAVALSSLEEHAETVSERGQVVMAVVIYQGFAIVPVFAAIPLLASHHTLGGATQGAPVPMILETLKVGSAIAAVYLFARYALPRALAFVARKRGIEVFTLIIVAAVRSLSMKMRQSTSEFSVAPGAAKR